MPLKTVVKVGNISNLSDARYCAGMGVEMLGFSVMEGQANYVSPELFQQIRGWISGPKIVAEIYGIESADQLANLTDHYLPDYFELTAEQYKAHREAINIPCIVSVTHENIRSVSIKAGDYLLLAEEEISVLKSLPHTQPVLVKTSSGKDVNVMLEQYPVSGLALNGSPEIRPGYKEYTELSEILEQLDDY